MRLVPRSVAGRLALASAVLILLAVIVAGAGTAFTMQRFIRGQIDQRLDAQITSVAQALRVEDGRLSLPRWTDAPPFDRPRSGWSWQASLGEVTIGSQSLDGERLDVEAEERRSLFEEHDERPWREIHRGRPMPRLYLRRDTAAVDGAPVEIVATAPMRALIQPMWDTLRPVAATMAVLGLALTIASILLLRTGLRPLGRLKVNVEAVRAGRQTVLPVDQPAELRPLVEELNRLIAQNAEGLIRARGHVANLGHALNTPLASLALMLAESDDTGDGERLALVRRMQDRIRHHLGRARAAALGGAPNARTSVSRHVGDIADALAKIYADRAIVFEMSIDPALAVACERQDFDEMAGNLLDNAFKWGRTRVSVSARRSDAMIDIIIDDDGAGLPDDAAPEALLPGRRLDEQTPGTGFGLPIARELADLYGGNLALTRSPLGGLRAELTLPAAPK